jgi:hypothetical protein
MRARIFRKPLLIYSFDFLVTSCSMTPTSQHISFDKPDKSTPLISLYCYQLIDSGSRLELDVRTLAKKLDKKCVVFIGNFYPHHASQ